MARLPRLGTSSRHRIAPIRVPTTKTLPNWFTTAPAGAEPDWKFDGFQNTYDASPGAPDTGDR